MACHGGGGGGSGNMSKTINLERFKAIIGVVVNGGSCSLPPLSLSPLSLSLDGPAEPTPRARA